MSQSPLDADDLIDEERKAYEILRAAKNARARELDTSAYHIAQNRALYEIVRKVPKDLRELGECWGMGPYKVMSLLSSKTRILSTKQTSCIRADETGAVTESTLTVPLW